MPAKQVRTANSPVLMAESILDKLDGVPWPIVAFLEKSRTESLRLHTYRSNDPEVDRLNSTRNYYWIGCYQRGASKSQVVEDVSETIGKVR